MMVTLVHESHAYCLAGPDLVIVDISQPTNPQVVSVVEGFYAYAMVISENHRLFAQRSVDGIIHLACYDVSDPARPILLSQKRQARAKEFDLWGNILYASHDSSGTSANDISDPTNIRTLGTAAVASFKTAAFGNFVYSTDNLTRVTILDFTNPSAPRLVASFTPGGFIHDMEVSGNRLYVAADSLVVYNVSVPSNPVRLGASNFTVSRFSADGGQVLGIAGRFLNHLDVSDPANVRLVSQLENLDGFGGIDLSNGLAVAGFQGFGILSVPPGGDIALLADRRSRGANFAMERFGHCLLIADGNDGFRILDLSDPTRPSPVSVTPVEGEARHVAVAGNLAYVTSTAGLTAFDISSVAAPARLGFYAADNANFFAPNGDAGYLCKSLGSHEILDIRNPTSISLVRPMTSVGNPITVRSPLAIHGITLLNVSDPVNPVYINKIYPGGPAIFSGDYAYMRSNAGFTRVALQSLERNEFLLGTEISGFGGSSNRLFASGPNSGKGYVFDIANPTDPALITVYPRFITSAVFFDRFAAISSSSSAKIEIISLTERANPQRIVTVAKSSGVFNSSAGAGDLICRNGSAFQILDISDRANPRERSSLAIPGGSNRGVAMAGSVAYVGASGEGIKVIDISNSAAPVVIATVDTPGTPKQIKLSQNKIFVADTSYLTILDAANPRQPGLRGQISVAANAVEVVGRYAYVAAVGLRIIDVNNPAAPVQVGQRAGSFASPAIALFGSVVILPNLTDVQLIDVSVPALPTLIASLPIRGTGVVTSQNHTYISDNETVYVVDLREPRNPVILSKTPAYSAISDLTMAESSLHVTAGYPNFSVLSLYGSLAPESANLTAIKNPAGFQVRIEGTPGLPLTIEKSFNLLDWSPWQPVTLQNQPLQIADPDPSGNAGFFRAVLR